MTPAEYPSGADRGVSSEAERGRAAAASPGPAAPQPEQRPGFGRRMAAFGRRSLGWARGYFFDQDPVFWVALTPALLVAAIVFVRSPTSNYIFDEQEALLANPYVNASGLGWLDAFRRDFWGLPHTHSIGSYRPIPNLIWRALWHVSTLPWLHHWVNVVFHAANGALVASLAFALTRRRGYGWLAGACFLLAAVITEAVTGVVGIADVLGGFGTLLAVHALRSPLWAMPLGVAGGIALALFSKESALVAVPLVPWVAFVGAPALRPRRPLRFLRPFVALIAAVGALVLYRYVRFVYFPIALPAELEAPLPAGEPLANRAMHEFLRWFHQPRLPADPINNPLATASFEYRVAGALRVYWRGLTQVAFPWRLSGDYSFPAEPIPDRLVFPGSVLGALALGLPPLIALAYLGRLFWLRDRGEWRRWESWSRALTRRAAGENVAPEELAAPDARRWAKLSQAVLLAVGLVWVPVAYFPHSNVPLVLPTVRAERFWYLPVIGTSLVLAVLLAGAVQRLRYKRLGIWLTLGFLLFQAGRARLHALDYTDDLAFWDATRRAAPRSAKAHLNYSVMIGARGDLEARLAANGVAMQLAPSWPMAHVYYGDTLCRLKRTDEAWPHYVRGWKLAPNDSNLIALGLQCLWDNGSIKPREQDLIALADEKEQEGTWLAYLARDIVNNGAEHNGVDRKYRPRGYNEGPKNP